MTETEKPTQHAAKYPPDFIDALKFDVARRESEQLALEAVYGTIIQWDEGGGKRSRRELARRIVALAEQPAQRLVVAHHAPCQGMNCGITSTDQEHSPECQAEHAAAIAGGQFVKPAQQQEPYGQVTVVRRPGCVDQHWFYRWPEPPYLDNAAECHAVYTSPPASKPLTNLGVLKLAYNHHWLTSLTLRDAYFYGFRDAEAAHGIKE